MHGTFLPMKKLLAISITTLAILICLDIFIVDKSINDDPATDHTDNQLYIERAKTILNGGLLYRDVVTKTPPLINYLLVPPVYFGGSPFAFEIYFSFFIVLTVVAIYYFLASIDKKLAFVASLTFLFVPTTLATPTFCRQDESIVVFFFILPLLLLYGKGRKYLFSVFSSLGVWIKMHPIFLIPPFLMKQKRKEIIKHVLIMAIFSLAIITPFLILAFDDFMWFIKFYLLGEGEELQGISLWRLLDANGLSIPSIFLVVLLFAALVLIYIKFYRKSIWKIILLSLVTYFILYPKIHYEYYLMLFALALPYLVEKKKNIALIYAISILTSVTLLIEQRYLDWKTTSYAYWFFVPLAIACMLTVDAILIYLFHHIIYVETWLDKIEAGELKQ